MENKEQKRILTKGNVEVQNIKIGDIHYEYEMGLCIKSQVVKILEPEVREDDIYYRWISINVLTKEVISYGVSDKYPHYSVNLYDYEAYTGYKQV